MNSWFAFGTILSLIVFISLLIVSNRIAALRLVAIIFEDSDFGRLAKVLLEVKENKNLKKGRESLLIDYFYYNLTYMLVAILISFAAFITSFIFLIIIMGLIASYIMFLRSNKNK